MRRRLLLLLSATWLFAASCSSGDSTLEPTISALGTEQTWRIVEIGGYDDPYDESSLLAVFNTTGTGGTIAFVSGSTERAFVFSAIEPAMFVLGAEIDLLISGATPFGQERTGRAHPFVEELADGATAEIAVEDGSIHLTFRSGGSLRLAPA